MIVRPLFSWVTRAKPTQKDELTSKHASDTEFQSSAASEHWDFIFLLNSTSWKQHFLCLNLTSKMAARLVSESGTSTIFSLEKMNILQCHMIVGLPWQCNKDMGFYPSSILFTFHYLAFVSHDSFPYLSVGHHVTIYLLTPLPPLHLLLLGHVILQLISIGKWYCVLLVTDTVTPRGQVSAQLIRPDLIRSAVISLPVSVSNLLRIS